MTARLLPVKPTGLGLSRYPRRDPVKLRLHVHNDGSVAATISPQSWISRDALWKTRLCHTFERYGQCHLGRTCKYAHSIEELTEEARHALSAGRPSGQLGKPQQSFQPQRKPQRLEDLYGRYKTKLCEQWMLEGRCRMGGACSFAHGDEELKRPTRGLSERELFRAEVMARSRMCRFWMQTGSCLNGAACLYAHGEEQFQKRQVGAWWREGQATRASKRAAPGSHACA